MGWSLTENVRNGAAVAEEREKLQEPADQISLSSADSVDQANEDDERTSETFV